MDLALKQNGQTKQANQSASISTKNDLEQFIFADGVN